MTRVSGFGVMMAALVLRYGVNARGLIGVGWGRKYHARADIDLISVLTDSYRGCGAFDCLPL